MSESDEKDTTVIFPSVTLSKEELSSRRLNVNDTTGVTTTTTVKVRPYTFPSMTMSREDVATGKLEANTTTDVTNPAKAWKDEDMKRFHGIHYSIAEAGPLRTLGEIWFSMINIGRFRKITALTAFLALHLHDPQSETVLCRPDDQNPVRENDTSYSQFLGTEYPADVEKHTGLAVERTDTGKEVKGKTRKNATTRVQGLIGPLTAARIKTGRIGEDLREDGKEAWKGFLFQTSDWDDEDAALFWTFLAAVTCRLITKEAKAVSDRWADSVMKRFASMYDVETGNMRLPAPPLGSLSTIKRELAPGTRLTQSILKGYLSSHLRAKRGGRTTAKCVLDYTLLLRCSFNGLSLISSMLATKNSLEVDDLYEVLRYTYCRDTSRSIFSVATFIELYFRRKEDRSSIEGVTNAARDKFRESELYRWARLFDNSYFSNLQVKNNFKLAVIFAVISQDSPTGGIWDSPRMAKAGSIKDLFYNIAEPWKEERERKKLADLEDALYHHL